MKFLGEGMKQLNNNLKHLELYLSNNSLGENVDNMKFLYEGMK